MSGDGAAAAADRADALEAFADKAAEPCSSSRGLMPTMSFSISITSVLWGTDRVWPSGRGLALAARSVVRGEGR
ncbi:hypothetical protein ACFVFS_37790 [Kitasatospora sp. NPDC057692]|uniref:hypothetical protein n=1 Tax=Kitasatospora sp. NPDC057692 TaxID=3346215 RepID=UPI0036896FE8